MIKILFDLQPLQSNASGQRGVGRYTQNLIKNFIDIFSNEYEIHLLLNNAFPDSVELIKNQFTMINDDKFHLFNTNAFDTIYSVTNKDLIKAYEILKEIFISSINPDIFVSTNLQEGFSEPCISSVKCTKSNIFYITTLHDLVPFHYMDDYLSNPVVNEWYKNKIDYALKSDLILTDSVSSKDDIIKFTNAEPDKVEVVDLGFDNSGFSINDSNINERAVLKKYSINYRYFLYWGGADLHKNLSNLINAYSILPLEIQSHYKLLLIGKDIFRDEKIKKQIKTLKLSKNVIPLGYVPDGELYHIAKNATCFVFPSTHEGFGLPPLEAMGLGIPVIGSNNSSIGEVIHFSNALFDPFSIKSISNKMEEVVGSDTLQKKLIQQGYLRVKKYDWKVSALQLHTLIHKHYIKPSICLNNPHIERNSAIERIEEIKNYLLRYNIRLTASHLGAFITDVASNFPIIKPSKKRIFFDISSIIVDDHKSGIQRVTRAIINSSFNFTHQDYDFIFVYSRPNCTDFFIANSYLFNNQLIESKSIDEKVDFLAGDILFFLDFHPSLIIKNKLNIAKLRNNRIKVYHLLHDILPLQLPQFFWTEMIEEFNEWLLASAHSDGFICVSKTVTKELKNYLALAVPNNTHELKIGFIHNGADFESSLSTKGVDKDVLQRLYSLEGDIKFLMVGTLEPRKGHTAILKVFNLLWSQGYQYNLIIVGRLGWNMKHVADQIKNNPFIGKYLIWIENSSDEFLSFLYSHSDCLIASSEGEGFGLPLIEAAKNNLSVIARDLEVFREVAGEGAYYFPNTQDIKTISQSIVNWSDLYKNNKAPSASLIKYQTWEDSFQQILNRITKNCWDYVIPKSFCNNNFSPVIFNSLYALPCPQIEIISNYSIENGLIVCYEDLSFSFNSSLNAELSYSLLTVFNEVSLKSEVIIIPFRCQAGLNTISYTFKQKHSLQSICFKSSYILKASNYYTHLDKAFFYQNFSFPEKNNIWSLDHTSEIYFYLENASYLVSTAINFRSYEDQKYELLINNKTFFNNEVNSLDITLPINSQYFINGLNKLTILAPECKAPSLTDNRLLGIGFKGLILDFLNPFDPKFYDVIPFYSDLLYLDSFYGLEPNFVWSKGTSSKIYFNSIVAGRYNIYMLVKIYLNQTIMFYINGINLVFENLSGENTDILLNDISLKQGINCIEINIPHASNPENDTRTLGMALRHIKFQLTVAG